MRAIGEELPRGDYQRCPQCDMLFSLPEINSHQSAYCPRCQAKIRDRRDWSLTRTAAMAFTMLLLMPFAQGEPLLHIWLLGIRIDANVMQGIWQMTKQGDAITGSMVFLRYWCPLILVTSIAYLWFGNRLGMNLRPVLLMLERLKEWVMLDIYGRHWRCFYKGTRLCPYPCGCRLVLFCGVGDFNDGDVVTSQCRRTVGAILSTAPHYA